ncbi:MAG TPA: hypothetical protein VHS58_11775 [Acetobacteraceae bacterium]|nr:hypothetical protein [Acetobacteraceae bacterium]
MRRSSAFLLAATCFAAALVPAAKQRAAAQAAPPHAWLFGAWTGGLFPAPSNISAQACLGSPTVIFTRDVVLRSTLMDTTYQQRVVETARTDSGKTTFRLAPDAPVAPSNPLLASGLQAVDFGCPDPDTLTVVRRTDNEIVFQDCADFPNPLVRCPSR